MKPTDFAIQLTKFLSEYLPTQKNVSPNTIKSYRDVFSLFLRYCRDHKGFPPEILTLDLLDVPFIIDFLEYLETDRNCTVRTRNHRLSVLHAFFRYLQIEEPTRLALSQKILAIPLKRFPASSISYLTSDDLMAILSQPDVTTTQGRRDLVLLSVLYDTGARVQELVDITMQDLRLDSPAQIRLTGKGRKTRVVPLMSETVRLLTEYLREHRLEHTVHVDLPLFFNRQRKSLSRSGVRYILSKYIQRVGRHGLSIMKSISPHTLRRSKGMHLLQAGNPVTTIQAILGHADIRSTAIYAKADMEMKRKALEKVAKVTDANRLPFWLEDNGLMSWLSSL